MIPLISDREFRVCRASSRKESLDMLNLLRSIDLRAKGLADRPLAHHTAVILGELGSPNSPFSERNHLLRPPAAFFRTVSAPCSDSEIINCCVDAENQCRPTFSS